MHKATILAWHLIQSIFLNFPVIPVIVVMGTVLFWYSFVPPPPLNNTNKWKRCPSSPCGNVCVHLRLLEVSLTTKLDVPNGLTNALGWPWPAWLKWAVVAPALPTTMPLGEVEAVALSEESLRLASKLWLITLAGNTDRDRVQYKYLLNILFILLKTHYELDEDLFELSRGNLSVSYIKHTMKITMDTKIYHLYMYITL